MTRTLVYEAGNPRRQKHVFRLGFGGANRQRVVTALRFFEFWAQANCKGAWRVEETDTEVVFSLARDHEAVHFRLSDLYERFSGAMDAPPPSRK